MKLEIAKHWHGAEATESQRAVVHLSVVQQALCVEVSAPFSGLPAPAAPPGHLDGLWEHEVVEVFFVGDGERYLEVELGPYGHHLVLALQGQRSRSRSFEHISFSWLRSAERWSGRALIPLAFLPEAAAGWLVNAYRIGGKPRQFFVHTPLGGEVADFHRIDRFSTRFRVQNTSGSKE